MTVPELTFLAPPPLPGPETDDAAWEPAPARPRSGSRPGSGSRAESGPRSDPGSGPGSGRRAGSGGGLRMTRGARTAATNMGISEAEVRRCIDAPDDATPDPDKPTRTHFRRGELQVVAGADGMVLRVDRRR
jgi:hypothetical protein